MGAGLAVLLLAIAGLSLGSREAALILIPASGIVSALSLLRPRPRLTWAAGGTLALALGDFIFHTNTEPSLARAALGTASELLGILLWLEALQQLPGENSKSRPVYRRLIFPIILGLALYLTLIQEPSLLRWVFPLALFLAMIYSVPLGRKFLAGKTSEGVLYWLLGFELLWLASVLRALAGFPWDQQAMFADEVMVLLGLALLGIGGQSQAWLDQAGLWPYALGLGSLEVAWASGIFAALDMGYAYTWTIVGGVVVFQASLVAVYAHRARSNFLDRRLLDWHLLLEDLVEWQQELDSPEDVAREIYSRLRNFLPDLHGLSLYADPVIQFGEPTAYPYPLVQDREVLGHLYFQSHPRNHNDLAILTPLLVRRLNALLTQINWHSAALTDPLTGLANRRGFQAALGRVLEKARADNLPITIAILDIDHFKQINDTFGHIAGDQVLETLAQIIQNTLRKNDIAVRWGGEEFLLVLSGANREAATHVMERIRKTLRETRFDPITRPITVSAGIAGGKVPGPGDIERWLERADHALYAAKHSGRDRVFLDQEKNNEARDSS